MAESALRRLIPSARDRILSQQGQMPTAPMPQETFRGRAFNTMYDMFGGSSEDPARRAQATRRAESVMGAGRLAADFTPVVGDALAIDEARDAYRQGNMGQAAILTGLATLGMVPLVGDAAARAARGATSPLEGAMDMSTDARMQRADEGRFLPETVYHGTRQDIPEFDVSQQVKYRKTDAPPGAFTFSSSPRVAGSYTGQSRSRAGAANIIPAKLRMQNPFVIDAANHGWSQLPVPHSALNDVDPINYPKSQNFDRDGNERMLYMSTNDLARKVAASGKYDGVIMRNLWDSGNLKTKEVSDIYTVFDPSNIRSVNAAFDPAMRGSANILATAAGGTISLSALRQLMPQEEERPIE